MSRPVAYPVNAFGARSNFGVVSNYHQVQERFLDFPKRTVVSNVSFTPTFTGATGYLTSQHIQSDTLIINSTSATGNVVLPSAPDLLSAFASIGVGSAIRFWVQNNSSTGLNLFASPTGADTVYNSLIVPPVGTNNQAFVPVTLVFTTINGSTGTGYGNGIGSTNLAQPYNPVWLPCTGTYRVF